MRSPRGRECCNPPPRRINTLIVIVAWGSRRELKNLSYTLDSEKDRTLSPRIIAGFKPLLEGVETCTLRWVSEYPSVRGRPMCISRTLVPMEASCNGMESLQECKFILKAWKGCLSHFLRRWRPTRSGKTLKRDLEGSLSSKVQDQTINL